MAKVFHNDRALDDRGAKDIRTRLDLDGRIMIKFKNIHKITKIPRTDISSCTPLLITFECRDLNIERILESLPVRPETYTVLSGGGQSRNENPL